MNHVTGYLMGIGFTLALSAIIVLFLRRSLRRILADLCGTEARADFWTAFSNLLLFLVPLVFALFPPSAGHDSGSAFSDVILQLRLAVVGLVVALVVLGIFLCVFIFARPPQ